MENPVEKSMGPVEAVKEAFKEITPGLSLSKILSQGLDELKDMGKHGAHELAAALFNGSSFVMYPRAGQEQEAKQPEHQQEMEQERGGR